MVVVEREDRARARGARAYASIDGYAATCDAYHRVQMAPDGEEIVRAITQAIHRSGRGKERIGYVSYHGTSTVLNDAGVAVGARVCQPRRPARRIVDQVDDWPSPRSQRRGRDRQRRARHAARLPPPTISQSDRTRPAISTTSRTAAVPSTEAALCSCLGFDRKTRRW
jgi:3-oxoacyl-[acyl-carrier-protein] synthase II